MAKDTPPTVQINTLSTSQQVTSIIVKIISTGQPETAKGREAKEFVKQDCIIGGFIWMWTFGAMGAECWLPKRRFMLQVA